MIHRRLEQIEEQHARMTTLSALRHRVAGILYVSGYTRAYNLVSEVWTTESYAELKRVVLKHGLTMEARGYEQAHAQLREVRDIIDTILASA